MTYTLTLNESQIESLIKTYQSYHVPDNNNYTLFRAKIKSSTLTIFSTHKLLIQGNNCYSLYEKTNELSISDVQYLCNMTQKFPNKKHVLLCIKSTSKYFLH